MKYCAWAVGLAAVALFFASYLQKTRRNIILLNVTSRILYVLQYVLLGAFEGAVLDIAGIISSFLAHGKNRSQSKKLKITLFIASNALIITMGILTYKNLYSILPIIGVLLHTGAFWTKNEKRIRRVSFLGSPFWLVYNFVSGAYGSCIGDILSMVSLTISMFRYDFKKKSSGNNPS